MPSMKNKYKSQLFIGKCFRHLVTVLFIIYTLMPIIWMIMTSFKDPITMVAKPPAIFFKPSLEHYKGIFSEGNVIFKTIKNSVVISILTAFFAMIISSLCSIPFARMKFRGSSLLMSIIMLIRALPPIVTIIPLFIIFSELRLVDTHMGLVIIYTALNIPFSIWMLRSFIKGVPVEVEESAMIDGSSRLGTFFRITLPIAAPGFAACALLMFTLAWNEFMFALVFTSVNAKTMPVSILECIVEHKNYWGSMAALGTVVVTPILLVSLFLQKHLVSGLAAGSGK